MLSCEHSHTGRVLPQWPGVGTRAPGFLANSLFLASKHIVFIQPTTLKVINNFLFLPSFKNYTSFFNDFLRKLISQIEFMLLKHHFSYYNLPGTDITNVFWLLLSKDFRGKCFRNHRILVFISFLKEVASKPLFILNYPNLHIFLQI